MKGSVVFVATRVSLSEPYCITYRMICIMLSVLDPQYLNNDYSDLLVMQICPVSAVKFLSNIALYKQYFCCQFLTLENDFGCLPDDWQCVAKTLSFGHTHDWCEWGWLHHCTRNSKVFHVMCAIGENSMCGAFPFNYCSLNSSDSRSRSINENKVVFADVVRSF